MRLIFVLALCIGVLAAKPAPAQQPPGPIKIGVRGLEQTGQGSVVAARMAAENAGTVLGRRVEILAADHQGKPDIGAAIATRWFDQDGVDAIVDVPVSSVALAVQDVARTRHKIVLFSLAGSSDLTGKDCSPTGFQWTFDTYALAKGAASALLAAGGKTWFFITADYALERDARAAVEADGGRVIGDVRHAMFTPDLSSYVLRARESGAQVVALANAGPDTVNSIKEASEFGLARSGQKLAALLISIDEVHGIGLQAAQGLDVVSSFYWDMNDQTRAWSARFAQRFGGWKPNMFQAGVYSAIRHYLKAMAAAGTDHGPAVAAKMREMPVNDFMMHDARIRADGRVMHDFYLFQVKSPADSKSPWDDYKLIRTIPAEQAARPESEGGCPLLAK